MPVFYVTRKEVWDAVVRIQARNKDEAIIKVKAGEGEEREELFEYSHTLEPETLNIEEKSAKRRKQPP